MSFEKLLCLSMEHSASPFKTKYVVVIEANLKKIYIRFYFLFTDP